jgi:hypothetical protein
VLLGDRFRLIQFRLDNFPLYQNFIGMNSMVFNGGKGLQKFSVVLKYSLENIAIEYLSHKGENNKTI